MIQGQIPLDMEKAEKSAQIIAVLENNQPIYFEPFKTKIHFTKKTIQIVENQGPIYDIAVAESINNFHLLYLSPTQIFVFKQSHESMESALNERINPQEDEQYIIVNL